MTARLREIVRACFVAPLFAAFCLVAAGSDPPDSELNPVGAIHDDPDPIGSRDVLATTAYGGDRELLIEFAAGQLWFSWVDSASEVGWSEFDPCSEGWGPAGYESYAGDDVVQARGRIRTAVLAN